MLSHSAGYVLGAQTIEKVRRKVVSVRVTIFRTSMVARVRKGKTIRTYENSRGWNATLYDYICIFVNDIRQLIRIANITLYSLITVV